MLAPKNGRNLLSIRQNNQITVVIRNTLLPMIKELVYLRKKATCSVTQQKQQPHVQVMPRIVHANIFNTHDTSCIDDDLDTLPTNNNPSSNQFPCNVSPMHHSLNTCTNYPHALILLFHPNATEVPNSFYLNVFLSRAH